MHIHTVSLSFCGNLGVSGLALSPFAERRVCGQVVLPPPRLPRCPVRLHRAGLGSLRPAHERWPRRARGGRAVRPVATGTGAVVRAPHGDACLAAGRAQPALDFAPRESPNTALTGTQMPPELERRLCVHVSGRTLPCIRWATMSTKARSRRALALACRAASRTPQSGGGCSRCYTSCRAPPPRLQREWFCTA